MVERSNNNEKIVSFERKYFFLTVRCIAQEHLNTTESKKIDVHLARGGANKTLVLFVGFDTEIQHIFITFN